MVFPKSLQKEISNLEWGFIYLPRNKIKKKEKVKERVEEEEKGNTSSHIHFSPPPSSDPLQRVGIL
jgi:hypothetical protein